MLCAGWCLLTNVKRLATVGFAALFRVAGREVVMQFVTRRFGAQVLGVSRQRIAQLVQAGEIAEVTWMGERFLSLRSLRELQKRRTNAKGQRNG